MRRHLSLCPEQPSRVHPVCGLPGGTPVLEASGLCSSHVLVKHVAGAQAVSWVPWVLYHPRHLCCVPTHAPSGEQSVAHVRVSMCVHGCGDQGDGSPCKAAAYVSRSGQMQVMVAWPAQPSCPRTASMRAHSSAGVLRGQRGEALCALARPHLPPRDAEPPLPMSRAAAACTSPQVMKV